MRPSSILKRNGRTDAFDLMRIAVALHKALAAVGEDDQLLADELAQVVGEHLERTVDRPVVDLEEVQDAVIHVLQESGHYRAAMAYARYRDERERQRRAGRLDGSISDAPNLLVLDADGRCRRWDRGWLASLLGSSYRLDERTAAKVAMAVEELLAGSHVDELGLPVLMSLVDAALVRLGMHAVAAQRAALRIDRAAITSAVEDRTGGEMLIGDAGRQVLRQWSLSGRYPANVLRLSASGRLWFDGQDDPRRGTQSSWVLDNLSNPWQVLSCAFARAQEQRRSWRSIRLVLPPSILGHLERGARQFIAPISALSEIAHVYLACDGRTPLLEEWPFPASAHRHQVSIAVAHDDFLIMRQLQELSLPMLSGPHYFESGYNARVAVELAVNAQGLDGDYPTFDAIALALVAAARIRCEQLGGLVDGAALRYAISGLPAHTPSSDYLQRQVTQEAQRAGIILERTTHLSEEACAHLGRLLE